MPTNTLEPSPTQDQVIAALKTVMDPEIGMNVIDLGLIYDVRISGGIVGIKMTLTTPGCPLSSYMVEGVRAAVLKIEKVDACEVLLVWTPPWNPSMVKQPS